MQNKILETEIRERLNNLFKTTKGKSAPYVSCYPEGKSYERASSIIKNGRHNKTMRKQSNKKK